MFVLILLPHNFIYEVRKSHVVRKGKQSLLSYHLVIHELLDLYQFSTHSSFLQVAKHHSLHFFLLLLLLPASG